MRPSFIYRDGNIFFFVNKWLMYNVGIIGFFISFWMSIPLKLNVFVAFCCISCKNQGYLVYHLWCQGRKNCVKVSIDSLIVFEILKQLKGFYVFLFFPNINTILDSDSITGIAIMEGKTLYASLWAIVEQTPFIWAMHPNTQFIQ